MNDSDVVTEILALANFLSSRLLRANWYGFGSFFKGIRPCSDIDVLVVCDNHWEAEQIRMESEQLCERWPLHLIILTRREESETRLISVVGATALDDETGLARCGAASARPCARDDP